MTVVEPSNSYPARYAYVRRHRPLPKEVNPGGKNYLAEQKKLIGSAGLSFVRDRQLLIYLLVNRNNFGYQKKEGYLQKVSCFA